MNDIREQLDRLKSAKIMMVDDEPTTMDVLEMFLQGEGYSRFVKTSDSRRALDLLRGESPDVLLLDLMMPNVSGLEILRWIREDAALKMTPVIILTSSVDAETKLKALELGATDFLGKPVDPSELALRLRNTLAAKAYQDRLTYYDNLTGLPNRRLFLERLERVLRRARLANIECAVLHVDLDRFKQINDALGQSVGDALLQAVAERLEKSVLPEDFAGARELLNDGSPLARVGGDEFSLFIPGNGAAERAGGVARRILSNMADAFCLNGEDVFVTGSVGISVFPNDAETIDSLLAHAGVAMSHAKRSGKSGYEFYDKSFNAQAGERLGLENQLRKALERDEMVLFYQPKVSIRTGKIIGAEALMRWRHPELGLVSPVKFIPIAEETGIISALGVWALETACRQNKAWQAAGYRPIRMSVNVSSKQFRAGKLLDSIAEVLEKTNLDPKFLVLELTESLIMENPNEALEMMHAIKAMGLEISIDDFGTGYSSLGSLKSFPIDELKIDRSFVTGVPDDGDGAAIVTAIIAMARGLGLATVAEGVETKEQLSFLANLACDEYQGFSYSKPVPAEDWPALFDRDRMRG